MFSSDYAYGGQCEWMKQTTRWTCGHANPLKSAGKSPSALLERATRSFGSLDSCSMTVADEEMSAGG